MTRVLTNNTSIQYAAEASVGVLPGSPVWHLMEPNTIGRFGSQISTVARNPISKTRQRKKGSITDLESGVEVDADLTMSHLNNFMPGFVFANYSAVPVFTPTAVTSTGYTVASGGALAQNTLVYARGFAQSANNGMKVVGASSTGTEVKTSGLVAAASVPTNVELAVAGRQGAAGDLRIDSSGNLISTALDFTTLNLTVGQFIYIGGSSSSNKFFNAVNNGFARITAIAANKLTLDKKSTVFVTDDGTSTGAGGTALAIQIFFGRFLRNVAVDNAAYLEKSYQFEAAYPDLGGAGVPQYEYAKGNYCNQVSMTLPLTDKATMAFNFVGTDTEPPTGTRKTNAATPILPVQTTAFNTSADIARLRIAKVDETGITTDFKSLTVTLNNNVSPEKVLGTIGAKYMNAGTFEVGIEAQLLFTDGAVIEAIRNNTTVGMDFNLKNGDGGFMVEIPAMTLGGGNKDYPLNESLLINITSNAFEDPVMGTSIGLTLFPYLPT